jgi:cobyrinic acid a,c-diamide synthase
MTLIIAGERSGVGKTTVTLALLATLKQQGQSVQSFKVGPDYIDPMFHTQITARPCRNLDPMLTSEAYVQHCFQRHAPTAPYSVIEGVMGLFDGAAEPSGYGSTAHVAQLLHQPIALVVDCSRLSQSIAALVHGYRSLDPQLPIAGVVLNRVGSDRHLSLLQNALEPLQVPILGVLRRCDRITLPDRHLGLVPTSELPQLPGILDQLAALGQHCFAWDLLEPLLRSPMGSPTIQASQPLDPPQLSAPAVRLAVAQDAAFNFYYADNLEIWQDLGAAIVPWSPLGDRGLPGNVQGLYLGGGFPEMFAAALADNRAACASVRQAIQTGMPTYAECGGFIYLSQRLTDLAGQHHDLVGALPCQVVMAPQLTLGYRRATAQAHTPIVTPGMQVVGHEFHRSTLTSPPQRPIYTFGSPHSPQWEGWHLGNLHASYLHLHWGATPTLAQRFVQHCQQYPLRL